MPGVGLQLTGEWAKLSRIATTMEAKWKRATHTALMREAALIRGKVVQNISSGGQVAGAPFAPLSEVTLVIRSFKGFGGTKPLVVTASLRNSISVVQLAGGSVFVGIMRNAQNKGGKSLVNIAELMEFGGGPWTHVQTQREHNFLMKALRQAGIAHGESRGHTVTVKIPARPFFQPVIDKFAQPDEVKARFWENVARGMGYDFGTAGGSGADAMGAAKRAFSGMKPGGSK